MFAFALKGILWAGTSVATASATSAFTEAAVKHQFQDSMDRVFSSWEWDKKSSLAGGTLVAVKLVFNSDALNPLLANFGLELLPGQSTIDMLRLSFTLGVTTLFSKPWEVEVLDSKLACRLLNAERVSKALRQRGDGEDSSTNLPRSATMNKNASIGAGAGAGQPPSPSSSTGPPLRSASTSQATRGDASSLLFYEKIFPLLTAFENLRVTVRQLQVTIVDAVDELVADLTSPGGSRLHDTSQLGIKLGNISLRTTAGPPSWSDTFHTESSKGGAKVFKVISIEDVEVMSTPIKQPDESESQAFPPPPRIPSTLMKGIDLSLFMTKTRKEGAQGVAGFLGSAYEIQAVVKGERPSSRPMGSCETKASIRYDDVLESWDVSFDAPIAMNLRHTLGTVEFRDLESWLSSFSALSKALAPEAERQLVNALRWQAIEHAAMTRSREDASRLAREVADLQSKLCSISRQEEERASALRSMIQDLRAARSQGPSSGSYDPVGESERNYYDRLLDRVDSRLVKMLPRPPSQQIVDPPAAPRTTNAAQDHADPSSSSWREASGRKSGGDGYRFGDFTRSLFK